MNFKKDIETSKLLLIQTRAIFICTLIFAIAFSWMGKPLDIFIYAIPASAGCYIAAICFYLNKAKMENIFISYHNVEAQKASLIYGEWILFIDNNNNN